jgi:hypothetical protein
MTQESGFIGTQNVFVKTKFKSTTRNIYGLLLVCFNPNSMVDNLHIIATTFSEIYDTDTHEGWEYFEEQIIKTQWGGKYNQNITRDLKIQFDGMFEDQFLRTQLFEAASDYDYGSAEQIIYDGIKRILQDKNLKIEVSIQEVSDDEINAVRQSREKARQAEIQGPDDDEFHIESGATMLPAGLVLAPVNGKPLYEIRIGDKIMIKLDHKSQKCQQFISLYQLKTEDRTYLPVPADVIDIKAPSKNDPVQILTRIEDGVYAKTVEEERQVKLRMFNQVNDRTIKQMKNASKTGKTVSTHSSRVESTSSGSNMTIVLSITLALLLFILIVAIFMLL